MDNKKLLSEEKYQKNAKTLKTIGRIVLTIGIIVLVLGIILLFVGLISFGGNAINFMDSDVKTQAGKTFGGFGLFALGGFCASTGFGITSFGGILLLIAHKREITAFGVQQVMPVAQEGIEKMAPTIGKAGASIAKEMAPVYGEIAKEIGKGIKEGKQAATEEVTEETSEEE